MEYLQTSESYECSSFTDIEAQIKEIQERKKQAQVEEEQAKGIGLLESGYFDSDLYDGNGTQGKYEGYVTSIAPNEDEDEDDDEPIRPSDKRTTGFGAPMAFINDIARVSCAGRTEKCSTDSLASFNSQGEPDYDPFESRRPKTVGEKEDEYRQKRRKQVLSPARVDPFADGMCQDPLMLTILVDKVLRL